MLHENYNYRYPHGLDLHPDSDQHKDLLREIMARVQASHSVMSSKYKVWDAVQNSLTVYIPETEKDIIKKSNLSSPLIVPASYANLQTLLAYMMSFFIKDPILQYQGIGDKTDRLNAILLEMIVHRHSVFFKLPLALHTFFRDAYTYGLGILVPAWEEKYRYVRKRRNRRKRGIFTSYMKESIEETQELVYEGTRVYNVNPYTFFPDPNVSIHNIQDAEFYAYMERTNYPSLLKEEYTEEDLFNVRYLKQKDGKSHYYYDENTRTQGTETLGMSSEYTNAIDLLHFVIDLIPAEFDLSSSEVPETWLFTVAGDEVIVRAEPLEEDHGLKPILIGSPDFDGYSVNPTSRLEMIFPLQDVQDWLFNSHIANVKKVLNDMLVVDPKMVNMLDLMKPNPGKLIRLRQGAWGMGVDRAIKQLQVTDVTSGHMRDTSTISDMIKHTIGASDTIQGIIDRRGERVSSTEASNAYQSAMSKIQKDVMIFDVQIMRELGVIMAHNVQQYLDHDIKLSMVGTWGEILRKEYDVTDDFLIANPDSIRVDFDIAVNDNYSMFKSGTAKDWTDLYGLMIGNPELAQKFDMTKIFLHIARMLGANNAHEFLRQETATQVMPTEEVNAEAQKGNLRPVEELL
jgi:hypothetical protein